MTRLAFWVGQPRPSALRISDCALKPEADSILIDLLPLLTCPILPPARGAAIQAIQPHRMF